MTPAGNTMGCLPIRDMPLPDEGDDLAADTALGGLAARDDPARRGHDRGAEPTEDARQPVLARVHAATRLRDALEVGDDAAPVLRELQLDHEGRVRLARLDAE